MIKTTAQKIYVALIFIFMYAPIATLMVLSFNASRTRAKWGGFTLKWYSELFANAAIMQALYNTLLIAFLSALFSTVIGTVATISFSGMKRRNRAIFMSITNIPMLNAVFYTMVYMTFQNNLAHFVKSGLCRVDLGEDILTGDIFVDHPVDRLNLSDDFFQTAVKVI